MRATKTDDSASGMTRVSFDGPNEDCSGHDDTPSDTQRLSEDDRQKMRKARAEREVREAQAVPSPETPAPKRSWWASVWGRR
jgi:hypothetical protein